MQRNKVFVATTLSTLPTLNRVVSVVSEALKTIKYLVNHKI